MRLIVGLGNPGEKYAHNRHNIGFMAADEIVRRHGFSPWRAKFQGELSEGSIGTEKVLVIKPQTFMNESGRSVAEIAKFYKIDTSDVIVLHDELDLAPGKVRIKHGGGHAGHNGLRSLHGLIGEGYGRIRLGIGHPGDKDRVTGHVLNDFAKSDAAWLEPLLVEFADGVFVVLVGKDADFMTNIARAVPPAPKKNNNNNNKD